MGAQRRAHHRQQEAMRAASAEANRQRAMLEQQQQAFEAQLKVQREAMMSQTQALQEAMAPDITKTVPSTIASASETGSSIGGVRTAASKRKSIRQTATGAASLRIPLNVSGTAGAAGLNIG